MTVESTSNQEIWYRNKQVRLALLIVLSVACICIMCTAAWFKINASLVSEQFVDMARDAKNQKHFDLAYQFYDIAILFNPQSDAAYYSRGLLNDELGQKNEALSDLNIAIQLDPDDPAL